MIPDILGYKLDDALSLLESSGYEVSVVITKPTRGMPEGVQRVVKIEEKSNKIVVITVAREENGKGGVHSDL